MIVQDRKKALLFVFALALTARLGFLAWRGPQLGGDMEAYLRLGHNLLEAGVFSLSTAPPYVSSIRLPPLYPAFLAIVGWLSNWSLLTLIVVQALLGSFVAVMILGLARAVSPAAWAFGAACVYALHPDGIYVTQTVLTETLFMFLVVSAVVALLSGLTRNQLWLTALGGALIGLAALCRSIALLLPFVFIGALWFSIGLTRSWRHSLVLLAGVVLVITPWALRCSRLAGHLILIQGYSGINFYVPTRLDFDQQNETQIWPYIFGARADEDPYGRRLAAAQTPAQVVEADQFAFRQAVRNIGEHPSAYVNSRFRNLPHLFLTSFDSFTGINQSFGQLLAQRDFGRLLLKAALLLLFSLIPFLLGAVGLMQARRNQAATLCAAVWLSTLLIHFFLWVEHRFWLPVVPFLLVSALAGAHWLGASLKAVWSQSASQRSGACDYQESRS